MSTYNPQMCSHKLNKYEYFTNNNICQDWGTISHGKFTISCNGGKPFTVEDNIAIGNYNMMLAECPFYDVNTQTHESSHRIFKNCFPDGFPWELLDILSGEILFLTPIN